MPMLSNLLVLALIVADGPKPKPKPDRPEADEIWHLTLAQAIRIRLDNSEPVTCITIGAQAIPIGGFEPEALIVPDKHVSMPRPVQGMPGEVWPLSLREAIRIGLENSAAVRVVKPGDEGLSLGGFGAGAPRPTPSAVARHQADPAKPGRDLDSPKLVIARAKADASTWRFQADVAAHVRSIEQHYWSLGQKMVAVWARETALKIGEEILRRERAAVAVNGRGGNTADVAEAEQQVENFRLSLVSATSDLIAADRLLRNVLGLPASDNRRIVPETAPIEAKVDPVWEEVLVTMTARQPEILDQLSRMQRAADEARGVARTEAETAGQEEVLRQVIHGSTHELARYFLEIDANHKGFRAAQKLRAAAQARLEAQRAFHEEGRITIDRLLDAVSQYADAIAQESQYLTTYNSSIAALEEAKGTLLAFDGITVAEYVPKAEKPATDPKLARAGFDPGPSPTVYKLRIRIAGGDLFEVEFEVQPAKKPAPTAVEPGR